MIQPATPAAPPEETGDTTCLDTQDWAFVAQRISVTRKTGTTVTRMLDQVSCRMARQSLISVVGPTGSGKTTLLRVLVGLVRPEQGSVFVLGEPISGAPEKDRRRLRRTQIAYLSDRGLMLPEIATMDNIVIPAALSGLPMAQARLRAAALLERFRMDHLQTRRPCQLSMGQRRLAGIVRTLISAAPLVVLDEPTSHLDRSRRQWVMEVLLEQRNLQGKTVVFTTHADDDIACTDHVVGMEDGCIVHENHRP
jgi:putative ABC transport system ATP-binding protein